MLRGTKVLLRVRRPEDITILHTELYQDVAVRSRADSRAWRPVPESSSSYATAEASDEWAPFSIEDVASGELAGETSLWGINTHNRFAHIGISLRPSFRGRGLGTDVVRVLCEYGFSVLGLHRLQIETLVDNTSMIRAATAAGFVREGTLRQAAWVTGEFMDEAILGLLSSQWRAARAV
jgi:RimJ/RimL family protein N-acetyltransferase